jgi:hypothetical protein
VDGTVVSKVALASNIGVPPPCCGSSQSKAVNPTTFVPASLASASAARTGAQSIDSRMIPDAFAATACRTQAAQAPFSLLRPSQTETVQPRAAPACFTCWVRTARPGTCSKAERTQTFLPCTAFGPVVGTVPPIPLIAAFTAAVAASGATAAVEAPSDEAEEPPPGEEQAAAARRLATAMTGIARRSEDEMRFMVDRPLSLVAEGRLHGGARMRPRSRCQGRLSAMDRSL